jgi:hypothetical protein
VATPRAGRIVGTLAACIALLGMAFGVGFGLAHRRAAPTPGDRVFEAMVAAPMTAVEAEAAPPVATVAPLAAARPRRPRPVAIVAPPVKPPAIEPAKATVAALPREAMPPPFAVMR